MDATERAQAAAIETNIGLRVLKLVGQTMAALRLPASLPAQLIAKLGALGVTLPPCEHTLHRVRARRSRGPSQTCAAPPPAYTAMHFEPRRFCRADAAPVTRTGVRCYGGAARTPGSCL